MEFTKEIKQERAAQCYTQKRYGGTPANLKHKVILSAVQGHWDETHPTAIVFRLDNGGTLFWWPRDGSIELLGANEADRHAIASEITSLRDN